MFQFIEQHACRAQRRAQQYTTKLHFPHAMRAIAILTQGWSVVLFATTHCSMNMKHRLYIAESFCGILDRESEPWVGQPGMNSICRHLVDHENITLRASYKVCPTSIAPTAYAVTHSSLPGHQNYSAQLGHFCIILIMSWAAPSLLIPLQTLLGNDFWPLQSCSHWTLGRLWLNWSSLSDKLLACFIHSFRQYSDLVNWAFCEKCAVV